MVKKTPPATGWPASPTVNTIPDYTDTAPLPPAGQSALWKYKAIYLQADQRVGQWSDVLSLPVAG